MHPTLEFLSLLDPAPSATFNIETFTDLPKAAEKPKPDPLCVRYANLSLTSVSDILPRLEGAQKYLKQGMYFSPLMQAERKQFRKDSDLLGEFLDEHTIAKAGEKVEQARLYFKWTAWCAGNGTQPGSKKTFTQRLAERGFPGKSSNGKRYYSGLAPNPGTLF